MSHSAPRHLSEPLTWTKRYQLAPLHLKVSSAWIFGLLLGHLADWSVTPLLGLSFILLLSSVVLCRSAFVSWRTSVLLLAVVSAGTCRWEISQTPHQTPYAASVHQLEGLFHGTVYSVPVVYRRPDSPWSMSFGSTERTTFNLQVTLPVEESKAAKSEIWQVSLSGNARGRLSCGDVVEIQGRAVRPKRASNPGQFDFQQMLTSRGVTRQLFVNHFSAIQVVEAAAWWNPFRWASWLRSDAERILDTSLEGQSQQLAVAMFLGNRSQLPYELRDAFVASGTMHLLAISGLHVGILSLFVVRLFHVFGASRATSLVAMMLVICGYAMVTGFRPSVARATLFLLLFGFSQLLGRQQRLADLLSLTALAMTVWAPQLLVDTGAWLSFLSVGALAWYSDQRIVDSEDRDAPEDQRSLLQSLVSVSRAAWTQAVQRYSQMLAILLFSLPLTTSEFHVLSAVSLLVNVLLIMYTFFVLGAGYLTLLVGILVPVIGWIPAKLFSVLLDFFSFIVNWAADLPYGHVYLADFPTWFLPLWYGTLATMVLSPRAASQRIFAVVLVVLATLAFVDALQQPQRKPLTVTVLDIGHGSAAVIECGDQVVLVDAGSLNQGRRAAEIVSEYLWTRGWNHIDEVVISHADSDHYNALPTLISRFPIRQIVTSKQFVQSTDEAVQVFMSLVRNHNIDVRVVASESQMPLSAGTLKIMQPDSSLLPENASDNEASLLVIVDEGDSSVLLPGDLEKRGLQLLLPELTHCDVLVSPHHGSRFSNTSELAMTVRPALVVVSARDTASRSHLENVFGSSQAVWWTSEAGAIQLMFEEGRLRACPFHFKDHPSIELDTIDD